MELFKFKDGNDNVVEMTAPSKSQAVKQVKRMHPGHVFRLTGREPVASPARVPSLLKKRAEFTPISPQTAGRRRTFKRNDPCPCGSGKKVKHCCVRKKKRGQKVAKSAKP